MMLSKSVSSWMKPLISIFFIGLSSVSVAQAQLIQCDKPQSSFKNSMICAVDFSSLRDELNERFLTSYLVTDAPTQLIQDTQQLWLNRLQQCKNKNCVSLQINQRIDDLNFYMSMNQTLTQHYIKFEQGKIAAQPVHLKIHQLSKDRVKIEGIAYRSPNNRLETQTIPLLAYTTTQNKHEIIDNEHDCQYKLKYQKSLLIVSTEQTGCERFSGIYRLYD